MVLNRNSERTKKVIQRLLQWYKKRTGIFSHAALPETIQPKGVVRESYEHVMFITLGVSLDYQRSANDLWDAARKTWEDKNTRWVFSPNLVAQKTMEDLVKDLQIYRLSKKMNKDAKIWRTVSLSFLELFDGDPRNMFKKFDFDALEIFNAMKNTYGKQFPYLAGSTGTGKILSLWIRMMHDEAKIDFKNLNKVPMPMDIHTVRATITTGCIVGDFNGSFSELTGLAKNAWFDACENSSSYPLDLDEPLWNLSRYGCSKISNGKCPYIDECKLADFCVTANPQSNFSLSQNTNTSISTAYPSDKI